jgi:hypothetical protein
VGGKSVMPSGKNGLTFDHALTRFLEELQNSRETGAERDNFSGTMNDIYGVVGRS